MLRFSHAASAALLAGVAGLASAPAARASFIVIDDFSDMLPEKVIPGLGPAPVLWVGQLNGSTQAVDIAEQTALAGVIGGQRDVELSITSPLHFNTLGVGGGVLVFSSGVGPSGEATLRYGNKAPLNADFTLGTNPVMRFEFLGDLGGATPVLDRPVPLTITMTSQADVRAGVSSSTVVTLLSNGMYEVPLSAFSGVDLADVDMIEFHFDASQQSAVDFIVFGPVSIVPTPGAAGLAALSGLVTLRRRRR
jgi:hypothetical protein